MLNEREIESCYLGQFIPLHYHHNMLMDQNRMHAFKSAIAYAVKPGAKVLEPGGGTGVLSCFAAAQAAHRTRVFGHRRSSSFCFWCSWRC